MIALDILFYTAGDNAAAWIDAVSKALPEARIHLWSGAPVESAPSFPPDIFTYPVQPTHEIQVEIGNTTLIRYLAAVNGKWYEVYPCPTEKGIALIHQQIEQRK